MGGWTDGRMDGWTDGRMADWMMEVVCRLRESSYKFFSVLPEASPDLLLAATC